MSQILADAEKRELYGGVWDINGRANVTGN